VPSEHPHRNGTLWRQAGDAASDAAGSSGSVSCVDGDCEQIDTYGVVPVDKGVGGAYLPLHNIMNNSLSAVSCGAPTFCVITDAFGIAYTGR
jgi:hypothetical protein